jgi:hypothetical protein
MDVTLVLLIEEIYEVRIWDRDEISHLIWLSSPPKVHQRLPRFGIRLNDIEKSFPTSGRTLNFH